MVDSTTSTTPTRLTGGQALVAQLVREGVTHVFGLPGDQTMHALDAFYDEPSIRFVTTRHEQGTTYLADGYARGGGRPGRRVRGARGGHVQRRRRPGHRVRRPPPPSC